MSTEFDKDRARILSDLLAAEKQYMSDLESKQKDLAMIKVVCDLDSEKPGLDNDPSKSEVGRMESFLEELSEKTRKVREGVRMSEEILEQPLDPNGHAIDNIIGQFARRDDSLGDFLGDAPKNFEGVLKPAIEKYRAQIDSLGVRMSLVDLSEEISTDPELGDKDMARYQKALKGLYQAKDLSGLADGLEAISKDIDKTIAKGEKTTPKWKIYGKKVKLLAKAAGRFLTFNSKKAKKHMQEASRAFADAKKKDKGRRAMKGKSWVDRIKEQKSEIQKSI